MDKDLDKTKHIEEEAFLIEHSGEIPEVAMHSSLYYLTEDPEGPALSLDDADLSPLKEAVVERYRQIILRDLDPANRDRRIYRGLARCVANWQRLLRFCAGEAMDYRSIKVETADALRKFMAIEAAEVISNSRSSSVNCSVDELRTLTESLGLVEDDLPAGWSSLCQPSF